MPGHAATPLLCVFLLAAGCGQGVAATAREPVAVFAAASTIDAMTEAARRYETATGVEIVFSFDASSNLARLIRAGAPADVFLSADERWMDDLQSAGLIDPATRGDLLGNDLVMIAPAGEPFEVALSRDFDLAARLPDIKRFAVADPAHVPAGRYARQALEWLGWWATLEPRLIPALDVRAALRLVELGEADAGIVYRTDAAASDKVVQLAAFPPESHAPIRYPLALTAGAGPGAAGFVLFLRSAEAAAIFEQRGFRALAHRGED